MDDLKEWMVNYLKSRDVFDQMIKSFDSAPGFDLLVRRKDADFYVIIMPELSDAERIAKNCADKKCGVVCLNSKDNVHFLVKNWDFLKAVQGLCFYFVNPKNNTKWVLYPKTHDLVTEKSSLKKGLEALRLSIEE